MRVILAVLGLAALPLLAQSPFYSEQQYQLGHSLFDNISTDLRAAETSAPVALIDSAQTQVQNLERNWINGVYNHRQIDDTILSLETIVNRTASPSDRRNLGTDVSRLLDLRKEYY